MRGVVICHFGMNVIIVTRLIAYLLFSKKIIKNKLQLTHCKPHFAHSKLQITRANQT